MFENHNKNNLIYAILIILAGLSFRLWGLDNTLLDYASYRQTYTAMFARNYFLHGIDFLNPQLNIYGIKNISEFPLYPALIAVFYNIFGPYEILGRVVSIAFFVFTSFHFFRLSKNLFNEKIALYALLIYASLPMMIYYNRTYMLESMMLYFSIAALDYLYCWFQTGSRIKMIQAMIYFSIVFLLKIPTLYLIFPICWLLYKKYGVNLKLLEYLIIFILLMIPAFLWYFVVPEFMVNQPGIIDRSSSLKAKVFSLDTLMLRIYLYSSFDTWKKLFLVRIFDYHITPVGSILILFWMIQKFRTKKMKPLSGNSIGSISINKIQNLLLNAFKRAKLLFWEMKVSSGLLVIWISGFLLFILLFPVFNILHEYYQIPILAPISILLALLIVDLENVFSKHKNYNFAIVGFFILLIIYSGYKVNTRLSENKKQHELALQIKKLTKNKDKITILESLPKPEVFYYSERSGFIIPVFSHSEDLPTIPEDIFMESSLKMFRDYKNAGSKVLVIPDSSYPQVAAKLILKIRNHCPVIWEPVYSKTNIQGIYSMACDLETK